jgi:ATP-dependent DNA helicase RecG
MPLQVETISEEEALKIQLLDEGQFGDVKSREKSPSSLSEDISAFANADGGDLYVGITDKERYWIGFDKVEDANGFLQLFENFFPLGTDFQYRFLRCETKKGLVLHIAIQKTMRVMYASNKTAYLRRGAQSLPCNTLEKLKRLENTKGVASFESESTNIGKQVITESYVTKKFIDEVAPKAAPEPWLRKQVLIREERPTVAGVLLFAEEPQAVLPKNCGIKISRYKTTNPVGKRDNLDGIPTTIEGHLYKQIEEAVTCTLEMIANFKKGACDQVIFPRDALHEIVTNAVLHRDYSVKDDIHIRVFDDRVEIQSPGKLPAHITLDNILEERYARNGTIVRLMNKFPDPPNKDIGEGLKTAIALMNEAGLEAPTIRDLENSVTVIMKHQRLPKAS